MGFGQSRLISVLMGPQRSRLFKRILIGFCLCGPLKPLDLIDPFWMMPIQKNTLQIHNFVVVFVVLKFWNSILLICNMLVTGSLHLNYHLETQYSIPLSQLLIVVGLSDHESWTALLIHLENYCLETVNWTSGCDVLSTVVDALLNDHRTVKKKINSTTLHGIWDTRFFFAIILYITSISLKCWGNLR